MNYISLSARFVFVALVIGILPLAVSANTQEPREVVEAPRGVADAPLKASELASLVLSVAALATAGIALSRTGKRHH